jgi:hypothetical protein
MLQYWMTENSENKLILKQYVAILDDGEFRK